MSDINELFLEMVADLEIEEPMDVVDYTTITDSELAVAFSEIRARLFRMKELFTPNPIGEAAELRSKMAAINTEMRRRWGK